MGAAAVATSNSCRHANGREDWNCAQLTQSMMLQPEAKFNPTFGHTHETDARTCYVNFRKSSMSTKSRNQFRVEEIGLCLCIEEPWLAASPDGIVFEPDGSVGVLEIKGNEVD